IGGGVVLDPLALIEERDGIEKILGEPIKGRLFVSNRCHLILPYHRVLEAAIENKLGDKKIGTTSRGIGPAYEDKMGRRGLRVCDLMDIQTLPEKIRARVAEKNEALEALNHSETIDAEPIIESYKRYADEIRPYIADTASLMNRVIAE